MSKVTAKDIVRSVGLSSEIEAHLTHPQDLDGDKLYDIFIQIKKHIGLYEAKNFASMLQTLDPLSTVNFLHSLYQLESECWIFDHCRNSNNGLKIKSDFFKHFGE